MFAFAVVTAKQGRAVPPRVRDLLADPRPAEVPFDPRHHVVWHDTDRAVWVGIWQVADRLGIGRRWTVRPDGLTAFGGHPWHPSWPSTAPVAWAEQLADQLARRPLPELAPDLDGPFTALSIGADGRGCVTADPLGMSLLVRAEDADVVVASTRAELAARIVGGGRPARDVEAAGLMIHGSTLAAGHTGFAGVRRVPEGSILQVGPGRPLEVRTWDPTPWRGDVDLRDADIRHVAAEVDRPLRARVRMSAGLPSGRRMFELTGGHDSRLVLALARSEGLAHRFTYLTWGAEDLGDVRVARRLADRLDLDHRSTATTRPGPCPDPLDGPVAPDPAPPAVAGDRGFEAELRHHVWATSCARSLWDRIPSALQPSPNISVCGIFGELLRTVSARTLELHDERQLRSYVGSGGLQTDRAGVLRPDVRAHYDDLRSEQVVALLASATSVADALDGNYVRTRLREWFASGHEHDQRNRVYPLYSLAAVRASFALGAERRARDELVFRLMTGADDGLAREPFAGAGWPAPTVAGRPGVYPSSPPVPPFTQGRAVTAARLARQRWRRLTGSAGHDRGPETSAAAAARAAELRGQLPVLRSIVDLPRHHALFDLVDRRRALRAIDRLPDLPPLGRRAVYDLVTAAIWLDHGEARADR